MILLTVVSQQAVSPKMAALRVQMGSIQATAEDSPLLAEFGRLHRVSASLEGAVLLAGFAALYLMVRESRLGSKISISGYNNRTPPPLFSKVLISKRS